MPDSAQINSVLTVATKLKFFVLIIISDNKKIIKKYTRPLTRPQINFLCSMPFPMINPLKKLAIMYVIITKTLTTVAERLVLSMNADVISNNIAETTKLTRTDLISSITTGFFFSTCSIGSPLSYQNIFFMKYIMI